jgi:hypothetical protein
MHARVKTDNAYRCRRCRERRRRGVFCASPVEVDGQILDFLERMRWLKEGDACDTKKIAEAITGLLSQSAKI